MFLDYLLQFPSKTTARETIRIHSHRNVPQYPTPIPCNPIWALNENNVVRPFATSVQLLVIYMSEKQKQRVVQVHDDSSERQGQELPQSILHLTESFPQTHVLFIAKA